MTLREQAERLDLAIALLAAVETGVIDAQAVERHLPEIIDMVRASLLEHRDELQHDGKALQAFIVRGIDSGHGFVGYDRAGSIAEYHRHLADARARIARCERFLALVGPTSAGRHERPAPRRHERSEEEGQAQGSRRTRRLGLRDLRRAARPDRRSGGP